jgi:hypothetical protein
MDGCLPWFSTECMVNATTNISDFYQLCAMPAVPCLLVDPQGVFQVTALTSISVAAKRYSTDTGEGQLQCCRLRHPQQLQRQQQQWQRPVSCFCNRVPPLCCCCVLAILDPLPQHRLASIYSHPPPLSPPPPKHPPTPPPPKTDVLLAAVRELAGPDPKLFPSAALVVNTLKVIQTLEQIGEQLQVGVAHCRHSVQGACLHVVCTLTMPSTPVSCPSAASMTGTGARGSGIRHCLCHSSHHGVRAFVILCIHELGSDGRLYLCLQLMH